MYSLPLCGHGAFRSGVLLNVYDNSRFVGSQVSHVLFLFFACGLKRDLVTLLLLFVWWIWVFFFSLLHPSLFSLLAVFQSASVFNQDVSKWITSAVTNMALSKCTCSLPLCGHVACRCCVLKYMTTRGSSNHKSHTCYSFILFVV